MPFSLSFSFPNSFSKSFYFLLTVLHIPIASSVFSLHWQMKITMRLKSNCCRLPLSHGLPTHKLLSTLLRKISLLFYHGRRTGRVWFTSLQTILSHPAFPKCFLLIVKPCKSKRTLNMLNPKAASLSKGETREAFHSS